MCIYENIPIVSLVSKSKIIDSVINRGKADIGDSENEKISIEELLNILGKTT